MMKQTPHALSMLIRAYRSLFAKAYAKGLLAGAIALIGTGTALANEPDKIGNGDYDYVVTDDATAYEDIKDTIVTETVIITDQGVNAGKDEDGKPIKVDLGGSFYLDGGWNNYIYNQALDTTTKIGSITTKAQPLIDDSGSITGNYIKNSGKELSIGKLVLENKPLDDNDRNNIEVIAEAIKDLTGNNIDEIDLKEVLRAGIQIIEDTHLNLTTLEFRSEKGIQAAADQTIRVDSAEVGKYSVLRVIDSTVDKEEAGEEAGVTYHTLYENSYNRCYRNLSFIANL